jgi:hypothetical protein
MKSRSWRRATTWLLALMQLHLLVVLVLHHHVLSGISLDLTDTPTNISNTNRQSQPVGGPTSYCTACQILRHSAVRPSLGNPAQYRSSVAPLRSLLAAAIVVSTQPAAWHGRAPPLA